MQVRDPVQASRKNGGRTRQEGSGRQAPHRQARTGLWHTGSGYVGCLNPGEAGLLMPWATSVPDSPDLSVLFSAAVRPVPEVLCDGH